jgi:DNA-binding NarL/FixJ family response regulator
MAARLLIVDDHEPFRSFVASLLDGPRFAVVGVAEDGESALDAVEALVPDLVLLDIQLPGIDGFEVAERLASRSGHPQVVLTSTREAEDFGARLRNAPVRGFIPKHRMSVASIEAVLAGPCSNGSAA